jgi:DNA topoisomerase I
VLACAVRLLDRGFFRIGSEQYSESFGLATMRKAHVRIEDDRMVFDYPAKSGRRRVQAVVDPQASRIVAALKRRRSGRELLAYKAGRRWQDVRSDDINAYLKERAVTRAIKEVAHYLGNTPAVCRASYIDPRVFDAYRGGLVIRPVLEEAAAVDRGELPIHHRAVEEAVLDLVERWPRGPGSIAGIRPEGETRGRNRDPDS